MQACGVNSSPKLNVPAIKSWKVIAFQVVSNTIFFFVTRLCCLMCSQMTVIIRYSYAALLNQSAHALFNAIYFYQTQYMQPDKIKTLYLFSITLFYGHGHELILFIFITNPQYLYQQPPVLYIYFLYICLLHKMNRSFSFFYFTTRNYCF